MSLQQVPLLKKDMGIPAIRHMGAEIVGYASLFDIRDRSGDVVRVGAFTKALTRLQSKNSSVKMLWQYDPSQPIGVWDENYEDSQGLVVKGRILERLQKGRECIELLDAGAIDGLSIGYRILKSKALGEGRELLELDLWEVSLVTFPMLEPARISRRTKQNTYTTLQAERLANRLRERNQKG